MTQEDDVTGAKVLEKLRMARIEAVIHECIFDYHPKMELLEIDEAIDLAEKYGWKL